VTEAFDAVPEPAGAEETLEAMASCNDRMLRHCASLRRLVLYLGECGCDAQARHAIDGLFHFFDHVLPRHHAAQEDELFPALLESMAGSDAVCIREITQRLADDHRDIQLRWLRLRPAVDRATALAAHDVEAFVERCSACAALETSELLPMAARLL
jgi:hypothetical protein